MFNPTYTFGENVPLKASCTVNVQYKPSAAAVAGTTYTATVTFNLNVAVNPSVSLTGTLFTGLKTYYIHSDHLDSPRSITNTAGQEVWRWDNTDPFGNNIANENPDHQGTFTFNLRFPGQYFDRETGLHYNVNRDYNPAVGRYVESDPIGLRGGINTFGYVGGNPISYVDPNGNIAVPIVTGVIGAVAGGLGYGLGTMLDGGCFNAIDFGMAVGFGAIQGALAPLGGGWGGAMAIGGAVNAAQTAATNAAKGQSTSADDLVKSAAIGAVAGGIGDPWNKTAVWKNSPYPDWAEQGNAQRAIHGNVTAPNFVRNATGGLFSTWTGGDGGKSCGCR